MLLMTIHVSDFCRSIVAVEMPMATAQIEATAIAMYSTPIGAMLAAAIAAEIAAVTAAVEAAAAAAAAFVVRLMFGFLLRLMV